VPTADTERLLTNGNLRPNKRHPARSDNTHIADVPPVVTVPSELTGLVFLSRFARLTAESFNEDNQPTLIQSIKCSDSWLIGSQWFLNAIFGINTTVKDTGLG
jgi:hypothetical protein